MRPRLLPDTHLLPSDRGVVISSPRRTAAFAVPDMYPWLERLRPFLDGLSSLDQLTADLPPQAARHVRALVELLAREGFVRDAAADLPHGLSPRVRARHAALIDFIAARADSPEHRFERYRGCAPVVVGAGRMASALVLALLASGVADVRLRLVEAGEGCGAAADTARLGECVALLQREGGPFRFERQHADLTALPAGTGVVLFGSDVYDPASAYRARALAARGGLWYGQAVGRGEHLVISTVGVPGTAPEAPARGGPPGGGPDRRAAGAPGAGDPNRGREPGAHRTEPDAGRPHRSARRPEPGVCPSEPGTPLPEPSPYLGGPVAALAANQLCLHLLRRAAGLDGTGGGPDPALVSDAAVLDLATGRFLGTEAP